MGMREEGTEHWGDRTEGSGEEALMRPGVPGATLGEGRKDEAFIKLADSFGELAREAADTLRTVRNTPDVRYYELRRWRKSMRAMLIEAGSRYWSNYDQQISEPRAKEMIQGILAGEDDVVDNMQQQCPLPRWWWDLKEGAYDEITDELRGTVDG